MQRIEFADRKLPFGKRSPLIAVEARKLQRPIRQITSDRFVAPSRLSAKHLFDRLEVNWPNPTAFYAVEISASEPDLGYSSRFVWFRQDSGDSLGSERAHSIEFDLGLANSVVIAHPSPVACDGCGGLTQGSDRAGARATNRNRRVHVRWARAFAAVA